MSRNATLTILGDTLEVIWTGSVWEAPSTHRTYTSAKAAMRDELNEYYSASGDVLDDQTADDLLTHMEM